jgi:hypothetical protein
MGKIRNIEASISADCGLYCISIQYSMNNRAMIPEPANCPVCHAAAERIRQRLPSGFVYSCPSCGTFEVAPAALAHTGDLPVSCRADLGRLRTYGYLPRIDFSARDGVRIAPAAARSRA